MSVSGGGEGAFYVVDHVFDRPVLLVSDHP